MNLTKGHWCLLIGFFLFIGAPVIVPYDFPTSPLWLNPVVWGFVLIMLGAVIRMQEDGRVVD